MQSQVEQLARKIVEQSQKINHGERYLVAIAGPPGSGKSTVVEPLLRRVNQLLSESTTIGETDGTLQEAAICVSLDGWHLYRHELDAMPDPELAHWRRGAAFTFDHEKYLNFVKSLRSSSKTPIPFFLFDHALKDPSPAPNPVTSDHKIVIIEGLYTLLDKPGWREAGEMMDMKVWIEVERMTARERLIQRNFRAGISGTVEQSGVRVDQSDMLNGEEVRKFRMEPTDIVYSIDEKQVLSAEQARG